MRLINDDNLEDRVREIIRDHAREAKIFNTIPGRVIFSSCGVIGLIQSEPTADAVPVVHGHWKEDPSGYGFWICSACGFVSEASAANLLYRYCPHCGADMKKEGDNYD